MVAGSSTTGSDVRSASQFGLDDLGTNGQRIEAFLTDLDTAVTEAQRQAPIIEGLTPGAQGNETDGEDSD